MPLEFRRSTVEYENDIFVVYTHTHTHTVGQQRGHTCVLYVCVCVYARLVEPYEASFCFREWRDREREREKGSERERQRERACVWEQEERVLAGECLSNSHIHKKVNSNL